LIEGAFRFLQLSGRPIVFLFGTIPVEILEGIEDETRSNDFAYPMLIELQLRPEARANVRQGQYDTLGCQFFLELYDGAAA
jgi:hypothetical protein